MATVSVTSSQNIAAVAYATGDLLTVSNSSYQQATLTIDGTVLADVQKVETYLPLSIQCNGNGTLLVKNTSTVYPLIVKLSGLSLSSNILSANTISSYLTVEGDWIEIYTSTGARDQTINLAAVVTLNGARIDNPPVIFAQTIAGDDASYVPMHNIHGNYNNLNNTAYPLYSVCGAHKQNVELGNVFEYDEYNGIIYLGKSDRWTVYCTGLAASTLIVAGATYTHNGSTFTIENVHSWNVSTVRHYVLRIIRTAGTGDPQATGTYVYATGTGETPITVAGTPVATGGWVPPVNAKIRIPNIHFTSTGVPTTASTRAQLLKDNTNPGNINISKASISNRFGMNTGSVYLSNLTLSDVGFGFYLNIRTSILGTCTLAGAYGTFDWNNLGGMSIGSIIGATNIDNVALCGKDVSAVTFSLASVSDLETLGSVSVMVSGLRAGAGSENQYNITLRGLNRPDDSPLSIGPITSIGNRIAAYEIENLDISSFRYSDTSDGCSRYLSAGFGVISVGALPAAATGFAVGITIRNIRLLTGGCSPWYPTAVSHSLLFMSLMTENFAVHDVIWDNASTWTGATSSNVGFIANMASMGDRFWFSNIEYTNTANQMVPTTLVSALMVGRFSAVRGLGYSAATPSRSLRMDCVSVGEAASQVSWPNSFAGVHYGTTTSAGSLFLGFGSEDLGDGFLTIDSGTKNVDFNYNSVAGYLVIPGACTLTYRNTAPIRGITSATGATATGNNTTGNPVATFPTNVGITFRLKNADDETWTSSLALTGANFTTSFDALTGYDSDVGLDIECVLTATSTGTRFIAYHAVKGLALDATYAPPEVGFIEVGVTNANEGASVASADNTVPATPVLNDFAYAPAGGEVRFEYPYQFDNQPVEIKLVARLAGYQEYVFEGQSYQAGKFVPSVLGLKEAVVTTGNDTDFTHDDGVSIALGADKTLKNLYDQAQYYSCLEGQMLYDIPVVSGGNGAYTANVDVIVTGWTLNGPGSLAMGGNTLTSDDVFSYTYTGGTFSQATTVPTFSGGTLNIGAAGTYTFTQAASMTVNVAPTAPGNYAFGDGTFTGTLTVNNATAHAVVIEVPSGTSTATSTPAVVTFSAPIVTADISITGMPNVDPGVDTAPTRLQIINTTAISAADWTANTVYATGDIVLRTSGIGSENTAGLYFRATTGGISHVTTEPTWDTTVGNTTSDGTVVWTTYAILYYDADPAATSLTDTYIDGKEFLAGETIEIRFAEEDPAVTFKTYSTSVIATADGFSALVNEESDDNYATYTTSGVTQDTIFSPNFVSNYIVLDTDTNFTASGAYAYYCYLLTTSEGMYRFWGGLTGIDPGNIRNNSSIVSLYFDCSSGFVRQTDDIRIFRSDGLRPALDPVSAAGGGIEINWKVPVNVVSTGGSALTPTESAQLMALPSASTTASTVIASVVDGTVTLAESMRLKNSILGGKVSGAGTNTETFRSLADDKDRAVITTDQDGIRTAVVLDLT